MDMKKILMILVLSLTMSANASAKVDHFGDATIEVAQFEFNCIIHHMFVKCDTKKKTWIQFDIDFDDVYFKLDNDSIITFKKKTQKVTKYWVDFPAGLNPYGISNNFKENIRSQRYYTMFIMDDAAINALKSHNIIKIGVRWRWTCDKAEYDMNFSMNDYLNELYSKINVIINKR